MKNLNYKPQKKHSKSLHDGFTLIELLVVMAVLGVLATGLVVGINPAKQIAKARDSTRKAGIRQIKKALENYRITYGTYPVVPYWLYSHQPGWQTLVGAELKNVPVDPSQTGCSAGYPWGDGYTCWWYAYGSADGTTYDLVAHLENPEDPERCELKQWTFSWGTPWCGDYSRYLYAPTY